MHQNQFFMPSYFSFIGLLKIPQNMKINYFTRKSNVLKINLSWIVFGKVLQTRKYFLWTEKTKIIIF